MNQTNKTDDIWLKTLASENFDSSDATQREANAVRKAIISRREAIESEIISDKTLHQIEEQLIKDGFYKKNRKNIFQLFLSFLTGSTITAALSLGIMMHSTSTRSLNSNADKATAEANEDNYSTKVISLVEKNPLEKTERIIKEALKIELTVTIQNIDGNYSLKISGLNQSPKRTAAFLQFIELDKLDNEENTIIINIHK